MNLRANLSLLFTVAAVSSFGSTIMFGPGSPNAGHPCDPNSIPTSTCVIGSFTDFAVFGAQLMQPTAGNPNWVLQIQMNYGATIPGSPDVIPAYTESQVGGGPFSAGDFLINWAGNNYGIVMHPHDGYLAGNLYKAPGYLSSFTVLTAGGASNIPNGPYPVELAPGGTLLGTGILTGAKTGNGVTSATYTVTDQFTAPASFLPNLADPTFSVDFSSYACANGVVANNGTITGGVNNSVPEPATAFLCFPVVLLLVGARFAATQRTRRSQ